MTATVAKSQSEFQDMMFSSFAKLSEGLEAAVVAKLPKADNIVAAQSGDSSADLKVGSRVRLHGLETASMNDARAEVVALDSGDGRIGVRVLSSGRCARVKTANVVLFEAECESSCGISAPFAAPERRVAPYLSPPSSEIGASSSRN